MTEILIDVAKVLGALTVIAAAVKAASKLRPVRWFFRVNVSEPLSSWASNTIDSSASLQVIRKELTYNDGSSMKDALRRVDNAVAELSQNSGT